MKRTLFFAVASMAVVLSATPAPNNPPVHGRYVRSNGAQMEIKTKDKKGEISGTLSFQGTTGQVILVAITDVTLIDNSAYIHGIVVFDSFGVTTGRHSYHRVIDMPGAEPDQTSPFINLVNPVANPVAYLNGFTPGDVSGHIHVAHH